MEKAKRAFELDALRGLAIFMMILHHLIFDLRYLMGFDVFPFQETNWFNNLLRPVFVVVFLTVSGICCQFSRGNIRRSGKLMAVAAAFSAVMAIASYVMQEELYVFFNILHVLAVGTFLYGVFSFWETRRKTGNIPSADKSNVRGDVFLILLSAALLYCGELPYIFSVKSYWLLPLGFLPQNIVGMGDYLPLFPWIGFFFIGSVIGRIAYKEKRTFFPDAPNAVLCISKPFVWLGQYSLVVYLLHQPAILAILFGLRYLGIW